MSTKIRIAILTITFIGFSVFFQALNCVNLDATAITHPALFGIMSCIINWPSVLLGTILGKAPSTIYLYKGIDTMGDMAQVFAVNAIGWGLIGALVGYLTSLILKWRKKRN